MEENLSRVAKPASTSPKDITHWQHQGLISDNYDKRHVRRGTKGESGEHAGQVRLNPHQTRRETKAAASTSVANILADVGH